jgi:hypothetical protein
MKICTDCKIEKPLFEFYSSKTHSQNVMCYCKECFNKRCIKRWIDRKIKAINYKGGCCEDCKISICNSHYAIFEFHHLEPKEKDFDWTKLRLKSWSKITFELDKCVLLCANCHRIRHTLSN